jgi:hypothetical protein
MEQLALLYGKPIGPHHGSPSELTKWLTLTNGRTYGLTEIATCVRVGTYASQRARLEANSPGGHRTVTDDPAVTYDRAGHRCCDTVTRHESPCRRGRLGRTEGQPGPYLVDRCSVGKSLHTHRRLLEGGPGAQAQRVLTEAGQ